MHMSACLRNNTVAISDSNYMYCPFSFDRFEFVLSKHLESVHHSSAVLLMMLGALGTQG